MVSAEAAARLQKSWMWWTSLDEGMQRILNDIAARAPQAVADVIGGPDANDVVPPMGTPFGDHLWSVVSAGTAPGDPSAPGPAQPDYVISKLFETTQPSYAPNSDVTFVWAETNQGGEPQRGAPARRAKVIVQDSTGAIIGSAETTCGPVGAGRSREYELAVRGLPVGHHWGSLFVPYADGIESTPGAAAQPAIEVKLGSETQIGMAGAASPADRFGAASAALAEAAQSVTDGDVNAASRHLREALTALEDAMQLAGGAFPGSTGFDLDPQRATVIVPQLERMTLSAGRLRDSVLATLAGGGSIMDSADVQALVDAFDEVRKYGANG